MPSPIPTKKIYSSKREREMFYLTTHSTHFIYGYMASDIWLRTILIVRKETRCRHIGYSYRLTARVLLYAPSHRQDNTYHGLCYTSRGALAGTRNSSMDPPHEGSIRRPIAPWANALFIKKCKCLRCYNFCFYLQIFFQDSKMRIARGFVWNCSHCDSIKTFYMIQYQGTLSKMNVLSLCNQYLQN